MAFTKSLAQAITDLVVRKIATLAPTFDIGVWQAVEATDANLSQVKSGGQILRYVPKLASASALAVGDPVLLVKAPGVPLIILGEIVGNIKLVS
jgi:hypothetical protein